MCKTDEIHESFYGLFNLRYTTIIDPEDNSKSRFFTNIAIGANSKPSQVNPKFQCVVVVKKSELDFIPPPFLNRFEKYTLSHRSVLETVLEELPPYMKTLLKIIYDKVCICLFVCLFVCLFTCLLAHSCLDTWFRQYHEGHEFLRHARRDGRLSPPFGFAERDLHLQESGPFQEALRVQGHQGFSAGHAAVCSEGQCRLPYSNCTYVCM